MKMCGRYVQKTEMTVTRAIALLTADAAVAKDGIAAVFVRRALVEVLQHRLRRNRRLSRHVDEKVERRHDFLRHTVVCKVALNEGMKSECLIANASDD